MLLFILKQSKVCLYAHTVTTEPVNPYSPIMAASALLACQSQSLLGAYEVVEIELSLPQRCRDTTNTHTQAPGQRNMMNISPDSPCALQTHFNPLFYYLLHDNDDDDCCYCFFVLL